MTRRWLPGLTLLPAVAGVVIAAAMQGGILSPEIVFFSLRTGSGIVAGVAGIVVSCIILVAMGLKHRREASTREAIAAERRSQVEARRRFIHRLDHEFKNPLTAIHAGLANVASIEPAQADQSLVNVRRQVDRLTTLVHDLRKLTDLESRDIEHTAIELPTLIEDAVYLARSVPGHAGREIVVTIQQVPWQPGPVWGDPDLLVLALYNLLDNALKFSPADALVEARAIDDGTAALVEIANIGTGIPAEDLPHLTEELFRGRETQGIEGSGLGLALVDRIVRLHGGALTIRSREGQGTVVTVRLPLACT